MSDLGTAFDHYSASIRVPHSTLDAASHPLARKVLDLYRSDPGFWLRYAEHCITQDAFAEASLALDFLGSILEEQKVSFAGFPGLDAFMDAFLWMDLKCRVDMLRRVVFGLPSAQEALITTLGRMVRFPQRDIREQLLSALVSMKTTLNQDAAARWERQLEQVLSHFGVDEFAWVLDLANALVGAGRFAEAEALLEAPFHATTIEGQESVERQKQWYRILLGWLRTFLQAPLSRVTPFSAEADRYLLPIIVWGDSYLDSLEQFTLPSLLAEGNLPYLQKSGEVHLLILTTAAGAERLRKMTVLQKAKDLVSVDIVTFPTELTVRPDIYRLMSTLHLGSMAIAKASHSHFIFLAPDVVFSDTFLRTLAHRMHQGSEVVFVPGLILHSETFESHLRQHHPTVDHVLAISPTDLLALGMQHLHPFVKHAYPYHPGGRRSTVAVLMWPLGEGGWVVHGYHHTPFLITAEAMARFDGSMFTTLDGDFLPRILRTQDEIDRCSMITDPREANYFELSRGDRFGLTTGTDLGKYDMGAFDLGRLSRFGALLGDVAQWLLPQKICFDPSGAAEDDPAHQASAQVVAHISEGVIHLKQSDAHLPFGMASRPPADD